MALIGQRKAAGVAQHVRVRYFKRIWWVVASFVIFFFLLWLFV